MTDKEQDECSVCGAKYDLKKVPVTKKIKCPAISGIIRQRVGYVLMCPCCAKEYAK